jgi:hypothetical protein
MRLLAVLPFLLPVIHAEAFLNPRAPAVTPAPDPCSLISSLISICSADTPGFTALAASDQASCVCFDSTSYIGNDFDAVVTSCASELSAQGDSTDLAAAQSLFGFCSSNAVPGSAATTAGSPGGGKEACSTVLSFIDFCESVSPGFTDFAPVTQAPCLCYSSAVWMPNPFDDAVSSCADFEAAQGSQSLATVVSNLEGFCSSVGDVGNPPTVSASATANGTPIPLPGPTNSFPTSTGTENTITAGSVSLTAATSGTATSKPASSSTSGGAAVAVSGNLDVGTLYLLPFPLFYPDFVFVIACVLTMNVTGHPSCDECRGFPALMVHHDAVAVSDGI